MNTEIESKIDFGEYDDFINKNNSSTFFHSKNHIIFLEKLLELNTFFVTCREKGKLRGIIPFFEKKMKFGTVVNSLPFFGSYGGMIADNDVQEKLLEEFNSFNKSNDILSSVIISNPFETNCDVYKKNYEHNIIEDRFTQCTILKNKSENQIWDELEQRVRWSIRKSQKNQIQISTVNEENSHLKKFYQMHENTIKSKNGKPKPTNLFNKITEIFDPSIDYDIFGAFYNEKAIAYVLVFYFKEFTEYYMPAYDPSFSNLQSTSFLIWKAMQKSLEKKIHFFNFGGTWKDQTSLYLFKRGWGTQDFHYQYYIKCDLTRIKQIGLEEIKKSYENFYVCPYNEIISDSNDN